MQQPTKFHVGVDLHKAVIQVCVLDESGEVLEQGRFRGESLEEGLQVIEWLGRWRDGGRFAVEAVGFNRWFVKSCKSAGLDVVVVDPAKLNLKMLGKKTDRRDAYEIARRLFLGDVERNATTYFPSDDEYGVRKLLRTRHRLVSIRQQLINQIRCLLSAHRVREPARPLYTKKSMKALLACTLQNEDLQSCLVGLVTTLWVTQDSIRDLTRTLKARAAKESKVAAMIDLPDMGPQTALTLVYELGDVSRFKNSKAAACYAGLVPRVFNSADTSHHGPMTKKGNSELRWILGQWAVRLLTRNDQARRWAAPRLRKQHKNKVRMALARRLLVGVYVMMARGEVFSLERCLAA